MALLTKDLISSPALWRLAMECRADSVDVAMMPVLPDHEWIFRKIPFNSAIASPLAAFEDLIYENPLLLSDFMSVNVMFDTRKFLMVPSTIDNEAQLQGFVDALWPGQGLVAVANKIFGTSSQLIMGIEEGLVSFVRRTFLDTELQHPISVLAAYFASKMAHSNTSKLFVVLREGEAVIIGFNGSGLCMANVFDVTCVDDTSYYVFAVADMAGFDLERDEIYVWGSPSQRDELMHNLRNFAGNVLPLAIDCKCPLELKVIYDI